jgi:NADPH-dependent glutamate synthase beta subunit-like oxidoreductase/Pyruvate/2-oxoacid:ferredoxin oxidoreductase delta subunit
MKRSTLQSRNRKEKVGSDLILAISTQSTEANRTGAWRYVRPYFVDQIAPCHEGCPAGEDIEAVMYLSSQKRFLDAYEKIREENPFPGICGRVCPHPCEAVCNRRFFDEPVSIRGIERFVSDHARSKGAAPPLRPKGSGRSVAVIGAGPAGLSCAYFSSLLGHQVTVFEEKAKPGGLLRYVIPEYRLPQQVVEWEIGQILSLGIAVETCTRVGRDLQLVDLKGFDAIFLAPGANRVEGPDDPHSIVGVYKAFDLLCAAKEGRGPVLRGKVAVVGGGNTAIDAARVSLRLGGQPIVLYRRSRDEMPAFEEEVSQAEEEGVVFRYFTAVSGLVEKEGKVKGLSCVETELNERDENGRRGFRLIQEKQFFIEADHVIFALGQRPDIEFVGSRVRNEKDLIIVDDFLATTAPSIFAGGDAVNQPRTVVNAIASGKRGAMAIDLFLKMEPFDLLTKTAIGSKGALSMAAYRRPEHFSERRLGDVVPYEALHLDRAKKVSRFGLPRLAPRKVRQDFEEVEKGFNLRQAILSSQRCFSCGKCTYCSICYELCPDLSLHFDEQSNRWEIDEEHCKGCGICAEECPRAVIRMESVDFLHSFHQERPADS